VGQTSSVLPVNLRHYTVNGILRRLAVAIHKGVGITVEILGSKLLLEASRRGLEIQQGLGYSTWEQASYVRLVPLWRRNVPEYQELDP